LLRLLEGIANGRPGKLATPALMAARLVPLADRRNRQKLRPIAVGEVLVRLAASIVNRTVEDVARRHFGNIQQGCGAPGGAQAGASHSVHGLKGGCVVINLDIAKAYPSLDRTDAIAELEQVDGLAPAVPIARWMLSDHHLMFTGDEPNRRLLCRQSTGLQQGGALSPLLFTVSVHRHLVAACEGCNEDTKASIVGYIDNVDIVGPPRAAAEVAHRLRRSVLDDRKAGDLEFKPSGHFVTLPEDWFIEQWDEDDHAALEEHKRLFRWADHGGKATALGVPLGSDEHMAEALIPSFEYEHELTISALCREKNALSLQARLVLLRYLLNGAAMHTLRVLPPRLTRDYAQYIDDIVDDFVARQILDTERIVMDSNALDEARAQARLRVSEGGLGFLRMTKTAPVAYLAGFVQALQAGTINIDELKWADEAIKECYESGPVRAAREDRHCKTLLPGAGEGAYGTVRKFHEHYVERTDDLDGWRQACAWNVLVGDPRPCIRKLQKTLTEPYKRHLLRDFRDRRGPAARVRIESARGPGASAFLSCLPLCPQTTIGDLELRTVLRLRLGTPIVDGLPDRCVCGREDDLPTNAYHLLACPKLNSSKGYQSLRVEWPANTWNERHQLVKDAVSTHLASAGICVIDEPGPLSGDLDDGAPRPRPDQLLTFIARGDGPAIARVCTDVSVVECNTRAAVKRGVDRIIATQVRDKNEKHGRVASDAGVKFVPLVASSLGTLHGDFQAFLQLRDITLNDERLFILYGGRRAFTTRLVNAVSCAIARGTGYAATVAAERLAYALHGRHSDLISELQRPSTYVYRRGPPHRHVFASAERREQ
jgi:hypothetical protein